VARPSDDRQSVLIRIRDLIAELTPLEGAQQAVASRVGISTQYLSDLKQGRRPMTELVARRFAHEFGVNHEWLLGRSERRKPTLITEGKWLPLLPHPVVGDPREARTWDGSGMEVGSQVVARIAGEVWPYVLRFGHSDTQGRLQRGDLILVSQSSSPKAEIHVIRFRNIHYLARRHAKGYFSRVANGAQLPAECPVVGYCVAVIWSSLAPTP
jgi:transcriptional regulator with XRE-family HTH domain